MTLLTACSGGTIDAVKKHEGSKELSNAPQTSNATQATTLELSSPEFAQIFANASTLTSAKEEYLKLTNWEDKKISASDSFRKFIDVTHKLLLQQPIKDRWSELGDFYLSFCDANLQNCKFMSTLRSSPYAASVVVDASTQQSDINKKYRLILLAFEVNNSVFSDKNAQAFLGDIKVYRKTLIEANNKHLLSKIDGVIQLLLTRVQSGKLKTDSEEWITSLSLVDSLDQNFNFLGGKHLTQKSGDKIIAKADLVEEIQKTQKLESSYTFKLNWLKQQMPKLIAQFNIIDVDLDPRFFIVEQLMMDRWSVKQAVAFYQGAGLQLDSFPEIIKAYMMTQIIYILGVSQNELVKFVKESDRRDVLYFFDDAKAKLRPSSVFARSLSQRVYKLVDFALQIDRESHATKEISQVKDNFDKSLRVSLTIPLTFAIFDIGNRFGISPLARIPITKYFVGGMLPYETLLIKFFRGQLLPLLDYTLDMSESNPFETSEGIEFALRSGLLESLGTTADEAMNRFIDLYLQTNVYEQYDVRSSYTYPSKIRLIQNEIEELDQIQKQASFRYQISSCESLKNPETSGRRSVQLTEMIRSPSIGSQVFKFFSTGKSDTQTTAATSKLEMTELSYNPLVWLRIDALETLRLDILPIMETFKSLVRVVEKNGVSMKSSKTKLEQTSAVFKKFATSFINYFRLTMDCWQLMIDYERAIAAKAVQYEFAYWKWAYQRSRQGLPYKLNFDQELPEGIEYRAKIGKSHLISYHFDLFIRTRNYITKGIPELNLPPIEPKLDIYFNEGLKSKELYKDSPMNSIPLPSNDSAEEFAKAAVKSTGFNTSDKGIDWFRSITIPMDLMETQIHGLAMFYRISPYLKQTLDIDNFYTSAEAIKDHLNIIKFVDLKPYDVGALKLLGRNSLYPLHMRDSLVVVGIYPKWIVDLENKPIPTLDLFLKQIPGRWMGSYGRKDLYENPLNDQRIVRPPNLLPFTEQGINLYYYLNDSKAGKNHLFADRVNASKETISYYKRLFKEDLENLSHFTKAVTTAPMTRILVDINVGDMTIPPYTPVFVENIDANINKFHQDTGGIFRGE